MSERSVRILSSFSLFRELKEDVFEELRQAVPLQHCTTGEMVCLQGEPYRKLYCVAEGWLKEFILSPTGREQIIRLLKPGDMFNEIGLMMDGASQVSIRALEDSSLWVIERDTMLRLLDQHPPLGLALSRHLAKEVHKLLELIEDLSLRMVKNRMARILMENAVDGVINRRRWMTQTEMAARLGTVLDVVNRTLSSLESAGLVRVDRNEIRILDPAGLKELSNLEE